MFLPVLCLSSAMLVPVLARSEPAQWRSEGWTKTNFAKRNIEWSEIISGGPPRDGIPPIDRPVFQPVGAEATLTPNDPVIGLRIGQDARAYPLRILIWHEIVNDVVGGTPVAVTYCPLCNSAVVFDRRLDGMEFTFGTSGKLRNSDLVMYDRQTDSWWQQFTGEAIVGDMTGRMLKMLPARLESFAEFRERHPDGQVLIPGNPRLRDYGRNPYVRYDTSARPFLFTGELPEHINPMVRVVVVKTGDAPVIVAFDLLRRQKSLRINDMTLTWREGQASALDHERIEQGRDVGTVIAERMLPDGNREDIPYDVTFAFVANAFHPDIEIIQSCDGTKRGGVLCTSG